MDHIVYVDYKAKELDNLRSGKKTMIIRGATGRKLPYGRVHKGDILYFIENKGDSLVKAKARVKDVFNSEQLTRTESEELVNHNQNRLLLDSGMLKRFSGKRYLVLIIIEYFEELVPFKIDRSQYSNMDDWLPVEDINKVKIK